MLLLTVVGARPQFIKCAPVSAAIAADSRIRETLIHTGQHYDEGMSERFFRELQIPAPTVNLAIGSGAHGEQTAHMLAALEQQLIQHKPDWVMVYGDTNSTLAGALAAAKLNIPIAHVESGLRSFNRTMPEEVNRVVADHLSTLLFAPTETAVTNLANEGIRGEKVINCGDVMYDATRHFTPMALKSSTLLEDLALPDRFALCTLHRAENTDDANRLARLADFIRMVSRDIPVLLPLHPRTRYALEALDLADAFGTYVTVVEPLGFLDMCRALDASALVLTDSGGLQKEAYFHRTPCITLRSETEWVELLAMGWNMLVDPALDEAAKEMALAFATAPRGAADADASPYGDGHAAQRIVAGLLDAAR